MACKIQREIINTAGSQGCSSVRFGSNRNKISKPKFYSVFKNTTEPTDINLPTKLKPNRTNRTKFRFVRLNRNKKINHKNKYFLLIF